MYELVAKSQHQYPKVDWVVTGWVGIVWSTENVLMNTLFPSDHLESLLFLRD